MKKIKILMINPASILGGGTVVSNNLAVNLDKNIFKVFTFFPERGPAVLILEKAKNIKILISPKTNLFSILSFLYNFLTQNKIDIIHTQGTRATFWIRLLFLFLKSRPKLIYTLHGLHIIRKKFFLKWLLVFLEKFLNRWADVLVCVSESDKKLVLHYKTISPEKIKIIKNGIDIEKFQIDEDKIQKTKRELGIENKFVLCSIGRLHPPKDFSTVLRALKLIISQNQNIKLLIVGDGPLRKALEKEAEDFKLNEYVKFLGLREDVPILINLSDIMILSSNWEGLPLTCLEAGACKKPIVASDIEGVREAVINEKTGYLFKVGSEKDLAEKILRLYKDKDLRIKMGERGYEFVSENFSKERMVGDYQELYKSIL